MNRRDFFKNMVGAGIAALFVPNTELPQGIDNAHQLDEGVGLCFENWSLVIENSFQSKYISTTSLFVDVEGKDKYEKYQKIFDNREKTSIVLCRPMDDIYYKGDFYLTDINVGMNNIDLTFVCDGALTINV